MTFFIEVEPPVATLPDSAAVEEAEAAVLDAAAEEAAVEEAAPPQAVRAAAAAAAPQMDRNERRVILRILISLLYTLQFVRPQAAARKLLNCKRARNRFALHS